MTLSDDTPGGLGRAVRALEVIEEAEPSDPEEDDESENVAGKDLEREEGRHRGWLRMRRMRSFMLQRTKTFVENVSQNSRINWQLKVTTPTCSSSLLRKCTDVVMGLKGSAIL